MRERRRPKTVVLLLTGALVALAFVGAAPSAQAADVIDIFDHDPYLPSGQANLAKDKTAKSSSSYEMAAEGWATGFVNDGKIGTATLPFGWSTNPIGNTDTVTTPAWVSLDLLAPSNVDRVVLYPRMDGANDGANFPVDYQVQTSADGSTDSWRTVATKTGSSNVTAAQVVDFPAAEGRFVRVLVTLRAPAAGSDGALVQLGELAVYGRPVGTTVQIDKPGLQLLPGESDSLVPTINGTAGDPTTLGWESANPAVATVDAKGLVTAKAVGQTTVTGHPPGHRPHRRPRARHRETRGHR